MLPRPGARKREGVGPRACLPARLLISLAASVIVIVLMIGKRSGLRSPSQAGQLVQTMRAQQQRQSILAYVGVQVIPVRPRWQQKWCQCEPLPPPPTSPATGAAVSLAAHFAHWLKPLPSTRPASPLIPGPSTTTKPAGGRSEPPGSLAASRSLPGSGPRLPRACAALEGSSRFMCMSSAF